MLGHAGGDIFSVFGKAGFRFDCATIAMRVIFSGAYIGLIEVLNEAGA